MCPFLIFLVAAARPLHILGVYQSIAVVQIVAVSLATWKLGASSMRAKDENTRMLALAGALLIAPWILFSLLVGVGIPTQATPAENQIRYLVLIADGILIAAGLIVFTESLKQVGERFYSTLGFAATIIATPMFLIWAMAPLSVGEVARLQQASSALRPNWLEPMQSWAEFMLLGAVVLSYFASASYGASLRRISWSGKNGSKGFVWTSFFAVLCLLIMATVALANPTEDMAVFKTWYAIPGFIFSIPAVTFIIPCLFGVLLLRRAGDAYELEEELKR